MPTPEEAQRMRELLQYEGKPIPPDMTELWELSASIKTLTEAKERAALAVVPGSAGDHSSLKCDDVVKYLRAEACRDVGERWIPRDIVAMLRATADYLEAAYQQNAELRRGGPPPLPPASGSAAEITENPNKTARK